ncbi:MAG TPA: hypothetical protein PK031_07145, partial [Pseudomonadales bacterium]|nr:hypothetical protein [Pseudomonadales bacterium]
KLSKENGCSLMSVATGWADCIVRLFSMPIMMADFLFLFYVAWLKNEMKLQSQGFRRSKEIL